MTRKLLRAWCGARGIGWAQRILWPRRRCVGWAGSSFRLPVVFRRRKLQMPGTPGVPGQGNAQLGCHTRKTGAEEGWAGTGLERALVLPEVIIPLVSASISSVAGGIALMVTHLSKQRTERAKHAQDHELERERLRFIAQAYEHAVAAGQAPDLVDLTIALRAGNVDRQSPGERRRLGRSGLADEGMKSSDVMDDGWVGSRPVPGPYNAVPSGHPSRRSIKRRPAPLHDPG